MQTTHFLTIECKRDLILHFLLHFQTDLIGLRRNVLCPFSNKPKLTKLKMTKVLLALCPKTLTKFWKPERQICQVGSWVRLLLVNEISACRDSYLVGVFLLGAVINFYPHVSDCVVLGDIRYVCREHDEHCICSLLACFLLPWLIPPKSFPNAVIQVSAVAGSFMRQR